MQQGEVEIVGNETGILSTPTCAAFSTKDPVEMNPTTTKVGPRQEAEYGFSMHTLNASFTDPMAPLH
jgi:hypothetical protein